MSRAQALARWELVDGGTPAAVSEGLPSDRATGQVLGVVRYPDSLREQTREYHETFRRACAKAQSLANQRSRRVEIHHYSQGGRYVRGEPLVCYPEVAP